MTPDLLTALRVLEQQWREDAWSGLYFGPDAMSAGERKRLWKSADQLAEVLKEYEKTHWLLGSEGLANAEKERHDERP